MRARVSLFYRITLILVVVLAFACVFLYQGSYVLKSSAAGEEVSVARPSNSGKLHVDGVNLCGENGEAVQLRGISTHGLTWYPEYIDKDVFCELADDWNCNLIRLAMYSEVYCNGEKKESLRLMEKGIEAAIAADMYVLVDWHVLNDKDPNINKDEALEFFDHISSKYSQYPNLIFEICNEPNGDTTWDDITRYSNELIPVIRKNMEDSVIIIGTPNYDRNLVPAIQRPIKYDNVMYSLHFYAASHYDDLFDELVNARESGLPVFVTECGISSESGDGTVDKENAIRWFEYLTENNIGFTVWNLSDKQETSSFFRARSKISIPIKDEILTGTGKWIRELIRGTKPSEIPAFDEEFERDKPNAINTFISRSVTEDGFIQIDRWGIYALISLLIMAAALLTKDVYRTFFRNKWTTFYDAYTKEELAGWSKNNKNDIIYAKMLLLVSVFYTLIYLIWRITGSIPFESGPLAVTASVLLLIVEIIGFIESVALYVNLLGLKNHPLPEIADDEYPDVDIFIATYNEGEDILMKTINGCKHLKYPDKNKVHIWVCDDNRRSSMRELARSMGVGYFDRPDNKGAKAGNLNNALAKTSSPYVVTLDSDMIVKSDFLLKTIPYFIDVEKRNQGKKEEDKIHLGLLQSPQCFYDRDVFQHALYSERRAPNEQDFFYRTIEVAKTTTNSVIYGGSNTVISRQALEDIGGFYTESITEDFATGMLIEAKGYVSMAIAEPLASGQTPHTFKEHIKQRSRWGRGVIVTARKLKLIRRKDINLAQKLSYLSSVIYWYSPMKNMIYMLSPIVFATFGIPVLKCNWLELLVFWFQMYMIQDITLRVISKNTISTKWSGIYETSTMPGLFMPILKESLGITMSTFKVTDKSAKPVKQSLDIKEMLPFIILTVLSVAGIIRVITIFESLQIVSLLILLFWMIRNLYFLIMAMFLIDGRESDAEPVEVIDAEPVEVKILHGKGKGETSYGVTTRLTEHSIRVFLDEGEGVYRGASVEVTIDNGEYRVVFDGTVTHVHLSKDGSKANYSIEILDLGNYKEEYLQILFDRIPSLPQSLQRDFGIVSHLWQNIVHRVARARQS
ncbi:MAG: glycosyltransferase [Butyrivibrio sp.]|nr:glycosyltransferase [Butyrivibrio sp.]